MRTNSPDAVSAEINKEKMYKHDGSSGTNKHDAWQGHPGAAGETVQLNSGSEPSVDLLKRGCSQSDKAILDTLRLVFKDGEPAIEWAVSWRGGISHADGAGGVKIIPQDMRSSLTPETLMDWISRSFDAPEVLAFATDERVFAWCNTVRHHDDAPDTHIPAQADQTLLRQENPGTAQDRSFSFLLTSQLVALWLDSKDEQYRLEYVRRLAMCGLNKEKAEDTFNFEKQILKKHPRPEMLRKDFVEIPLFNLFTPCLEHPITYYENHFEYPLSYIVKLSDEAEWHFWNSHEKSMPDNVWNEIYWLADKNKKLFIPFAMNLINNKGWTYKNVNQFSYQEQGMLDLYRWKRGNTRASKTPWRAESTTPCMPKRDAAPQMARDEARRGKALKGLLERYFGK